MGQQDNRKQAGFSVFSGNRKTAFYDPRTPGGAEEISELPGLQLERLSGSRAPTGNFQVLLRAQAATAAISPEPPANLDKSAVNSFEIHWAVFLVRNTPLNGRKPLLPKGDGDPVIYVTIYRSFLLMFFLFSMMSFNMYIFY